MLKDVKGSVLSGFAPFMRTGDLKDWISKKKMNREKKTLHFLLVGRGEKEETSVAKQEKKEKAD